MTISLDIKYITFDGSAGLTRIRAMATADGVLVAIATWQRKQSSPVLIVSIKQA